MLRFTKTALPRHGLVIIHDSSPFALFIHILHMKIRILVLPNIVETVNRLEVLFSFVSFSSKKKKDGDI